MPPAPPPMPPFIISIIGSSICYCHPCPQLLLPCHRSSSASSVVASAAPSDSAASSSSSGTSRYLPYHPQRQLARGRTGLELRRQSKAEPESEAEKELLPRILDNHTDILHIPPLKDEVVPGNLLGKTGLALGFAEVVEY